MQLIELRRNTGSPPPPPSLSHTGVPWDFWLLAIAWKIYPLPDKFVLLDSAEATSPGYMLNWCVVMYLFTSGPRCPEMQKLSASVLCTSRHGIHGDEVWGRDGDAQKHRPQRNLRVSQRTWFFYRDFNK